MQKLIRNTIKISIITAFIVLVSAQSAEAASLDGSLVRTSNGTIYLIKGSQKLGFPSLAVLLSHGFELKDAKIADADDLALPDGPVMIYREGMLIKDNSPTVFVVYGGEKHPFSSAEVFHGLGYSFANVIVEKKNILAKILPGATIDSANVRHGPGSLVNDNGTIYLMKENSREGIPTMEDFRTLRYKLQNVVPINNADRAVSRESASENHAPGAPVISGPGEFIAGSGQSFTISASDSDFDSLAFTIDFGDSSAKETKAVPAGQAFNISHAWSTAGNYNVTVSVSDGRSGQSQSMITVKVSAAKPVNSPPSTPVVSGYVASLPNASIDYSIVSADADRDALSYAINFGDSMTQTLSAASGAAVNTSHAFVAKGTYTLSVTANDGKGGISSATLTVKIDNDPAAFGPAVTLLTPNGAESYARNQEVRITWKRNWAPDQSYGKVDIYYSRGGLNSLIKTGAQDSSYGWVPTGLVSADNYQIEIVSQGSPGTGVVLSDRSDGIFSIAQ